MKKYALDANTISYLLKDYPKVTAQMKQVSDSGNIITIPLVAYYEVKRGLLSVRAVNKMAHFERLCDVLGVDDLSFDVLDKATYIYTDLRHKGRLVDDADIFIAAFCIVNDCILVTSNVKHFNNIDGLSFVDWN